MFNTFLDCNRIASADNRPDIIEYQFSLAIDKRPDFIAMAVYLIADTFTGFDFQLVAW